MQYKTLNDNFQKTVIFSQLFGFERTKTLLHFMLSVAYRKAIEVFATRPQNTTVQFTTAISNLEGRGRKLFSIKKQLIDLHSLPVK